MTKQLDSFFVKENQMHVQYVYIVNWILTSKGKYAFLIDVDWL